MITEIETKTVIERYNKALKEVKKKVKTIGLIISLFILVGMMVLFYMIESVHALALFRVFVGFMLSLPLIIVTMIIIFVYRPEKPYYETLLPDIVKLVNKNENLSLNYESYPKEYKNTNKEGGLFTRGASFRVKRVIEGMSPNDNKFKSFDADALVSTGNSTSYVFRGIYMVIDNDEQKFYQIRTKGKPSLKEPKLARKDDLQTYRIFTDETESLNIKQNVEKLRILQRKHLAKDVYISQINKALHLAYSRPLRKVQHLNHEMVIELMQNVMREVLHADTFKDADGYQDFFN